jgi:hypothetical protein
MAKHSYTKTLKKAQPTLRLADGVVKKWDLEVIYKADSNGWSRTYPHSEDVEYLNKPVSGYTKSELLAMSNLPDAVWDAHWEAHNSPPTEERVGDFNLNDLED